MTFVPCSSHSTGAPAASAAGAAPIGGSTWYSTSISSQASSASARLVAATAATGSPTKSTLSVATQCLPQPAGLVTCAVAQRLTSSGVSTATTPSSASAALVSTRTMRACGCGLRRIAQCAMFGRLKLSMNSAVPVTRAGSSMRLTGLPT